MDLSQIISAVFFSSVFVFTMFMADYLRGKTQPFGTHPFICNLILVVVMSMAILGSDELKRSGHKKARRNLLIGLTFLLIFPLILAYARIHLHWKMIGWNFSDIYLFIPFFVMIASTLPLALYLNRNQNKSKSQSTIDNAS